MSTLSKVYQPEQVEKKIYQLWEKKGFFNPDIVSRIQADENQRQSAFCIIMPPPNANGSLHLGHAVFVTLQDILIRYHRMKGERTLWLPGADHAGFETQVVYDTKLEKEGRSRFQIPRDELYEEMLKFTLENKKIMEAQLRQLGASSDFSREKFTLDPEIIKITYFTFKKLYEDGLVYRGSRIVHWCTKHQTALSDLEVKYIERTDPLYYIKYGLKKTKNKKPKTKNQKQKLLNSENILEDMDYLTVATVRLETIFGDTALAVNPKDKRYKNLICEMAVLPIVNREIPIIADEAVDPKFGTGIIKVTPAHDLVDFEIWQRHKDKIPGPKMVIDKYGRLDLLAHWPDSQAVQKYHRLKVREARQLIAEEMQKEGLMVKIDPSYKHSVATCYKCGTIIEPRILPQWFIRMTAAPHPQNQKSNIKNQNFGKSLRDLAVEAVKSGKIQFISKHYEKIFFHWMKNIKDWNISRQIVWGIRIPAWYCNKSKVQSPKSKVHSKIWNLKIYGRDIFEALKKGIKTIETRAGRPRDNEKYWGDLKPGEIIEFRLADEKTDKIIKGVPSVKKRIKKVSHFKMIDEIFNVYRAQDDYPGKSINEIKQWWKDRLPLYERIEKYGIWVIVLENYTESIEEEEVYIGTKPPTNEGWVQETDVFDTWFSSAQWPFATLLSQSRSKSKIKYQKSKIRNIFNYTTTDFEEFYPTTVMETGWDILFFWVARMIMLGIYACGKPPFKYVFLHGLIRDKDRQKMSKSKGNVIDPLGVVDLYGADALRMALVFGSAVDKDFVISEDKIMAIRRFSNKIWNAARFALPYLNKEMEKVSPKGLRLNKDDQWILENLKKTMTEVTEDLDHFKLHQAAKVLYHFFWHRFCDIYLEKVKSRLKDSLATADKKTAQWVLGYVLTHSLKLLHPFMPFLTEAIYQKIPKAKKRYLIIDSWPV